MKNDKVLYVQHAYNYLYHYSLPEAHKTKLPEITILLTKHFNPMKCKQRSLYQLRRMMIKLMRVNTY